LVLDAVICACDRSKLAPGKAGRPKKSHIQVGARKLAALWSTLSQKSFPKSLATQPPRGGLEFLASGPLFVHRILTAIDPEVTLEEVRTALKSLPPAKYVNRPCGKSNFG